MIVVVNFDAVFLHPPAWVARQRLSKLVNILTGKKRFNKYPIMPMGVFSLASCLDAEGFQTKIINLGLEHCLNPSFNLEEKVRSIKATVYAIDLQWSIHSSGAIEVANLCKRHHPDSLVVLGGFTATWFDQEIIQNHTSVDVVVRGEAEESMTRLVKNYVSGEDFSNVEGITYRQTSSLKRNPIGKPPSNLDRFDFIRPDLIDRWDQYLKVNAIGYNEQAPPTFWLPIARGCPYNCIHCGGSRESYYLATGRDKPILRSPGKIVGEIEKLVEKGVKAVNFSHDLQIDGKSYYSKLLREIRERRLDISAYTEIFQLPSQDFIEEYAKTFTYPCIAISPESASEEVRNFVGKLFSDAQLFKALDMLERSEIDTLLYFCVGLPGESHESFEVFKRLVRKILYNTKRALVIPPFPYTIDPNCLMAIHPEKFDVKLIFKTFEDYKMMSKTSGSWEKSIGHETSKLSRRDIHKLTVRSNQHVTRIARLRRKESDMKLL